MFPYHAEDYRDLIKIVIDGLKEKSKITYAYVAKDCGIQSTYLTRVLKKDNHLSSDQVYSISRCLGFSPLQEQLLHLLHQEATSALLKRKN